MNTRLLLTTVQMLKCKNWPVKCRTDLLTKALLTGMPLYFSYVLLYFTYGEWCKIDCLRRTDIVKFVTNLVILRILFRNAIYHVKYTILSKSINFVGFFPVHFNAFVPHLFGFQNPWVFQVLLAPAIITWSYNRMHCMWIWRMSLN